MTLAAGTRLGPYEIIGALGAGGMGEDYRARDTRLERECAAASSIQGNGSQGRAVGIKAPTGSDTVQGVGPNGVTPIDEAFQLGNGGWEMLFRLQGSMPIAGPVRAYGSGYYGLSPSTRT